MARKEGETRGRPSTFDPKVTAEICFRMAEGESLRSVCRGEGMPLELTVRGWVRENPTFAAQYALAREMQMDSMGDELLEISDLAGDSNRDRLRVDTRKWLMSKIAPKRFGDRMAVTGPDDGPLRVESSDASSLATALLGVLAKAGTDPKKEE